MNAAIHLRPVAVPQRECDQPQSNYEALGRLTIGVAHDFNTLLTAIMLYNDLIHEEIHRQNRKIPDCERMKHAADEIRTACERGIALIQQLMTLTRPAVVEPEAISWNETILGMNNLLRRLLGENFELILNLAEDLKKMKLSPSKAQQVVLNLVLNARDAMPEGGNIVLQTGNSRAGNSKSAKHVELTVIDTGCGMDKATLTHAFEPFFTTKSQGRGNGLGLATVREIVGNAGGEIHVESGPAKGTSMRVRLPALRSEPVQAERIFASRVVPRQKRHVV